MSLVFVGGDTGDGQGLALGWERGSMVGVVWEGDEHVVVLPVADRELLELAAAHSLVTAEQAAALRGVTEDEAYASLSGLADRGLLARLRLHAGDGGCFRVTAAGLDEIGRGLPLRGLEVRPRHALGVGWVWLAAREGSFGAAERVLSERQMRLEDLEAGPDGPFGLAVGDTTRYPDVMLVMAAGRVAINLLLDPPTGSERLEAMLRGYAGEPRFAAVLFLVAEPRIGVVVRSVAAGLGISELVHVQPARPGPGAPAA